MQIMVDVNVDHTVQSSAKDKEEKDLTPLVLGHKAWDHYQLKVVQQTCPFEFRMAPSVIIPMTIPVKFAIAEGPRYHQIRNMFKELDSMTTKSQEQEKLRLRIVKDLMKLFE